MSPIRVLVADLPPLLGAIVKAALCGQPDIEFVGQLASGVEFDASAARQLADVLIVGASQANEPARIDKLLREGGPARIVMIAESGREAVLYQLRPQRTVLGELSPNGLVEAVRGVMEGHVANSGSR